ncbi:hypothetical protein [uncultured Erythrobacter sp.]|uniref:hypothetical protein n=1 Tax=uncultured Erythrobacter sp. TaxID=263913 RepID=UPI002608508A|nr:hypothetical protein [uncultured Erythrobacter sp.]
MKTGVHRNLTNRFRGLIAAAIGGLTLLIGSSPALSQGPVPELGTAADRATYVDLVDLAERSDMVIRAEIRRQVTVEPERAPGLEPGFARLYIEARTLALIAGSSAVGESLVFLVDVPLNEKGKPDKYKKRQVLLFADQVPGRRGSIRLTGKQAMLDYTPEFEVRLRPILTDLASADVPPLVTGIGDALAVQGTLAGESETQIFVRTEDRSPVSITVLRRPGQPAAWGVSWGEIIDSAASAPSPGTLRWYRLACSLPERLPSSANLARDPQARRLAEADYRFVIEKLGPCTREITEADEV